MSIENQDVDLNNDIIDDVTVDTTENENDTAKDESTRTVETPEAKRARLTRQLEQLDKKYPVKKVETKTSTQSDDFDYGQKAFLVANGIKGEKEVALAKEYMSNTGKSLDDIVGNKHFLNELKEIREIESTQNATPSGTKRTGNSVQDTVEYWLAKGEMPPAGMTELRQQYVNAKIKKEKSKGMFYNS